MENGSMNEIRCLAGITPSERFPHGLPLPNQTPGGSELNPLEQTARVAVREGVDARVRGRAETTRLLSEGSIRTFDSHIKLREGLEKARQLVQRALATVQNDESRYQGNVGSVTEKSRADMYRADQELVSAVESIYAALDAVDSLETAKRAMARENGRR